MNITVTQYIELLLCPYPTMSDQLSRLTEHSKPFIVQPTRIHTHTVVLLHGLSTDGVIFGTDFMENALNAKGSTLPQAFPQVKFIFPSGAPRRCTAFGGKLMRVWFDVTTITDRTIGEDKQIEGLAESTTYLCKLVREEITSLELVGRSREDLVLGGFSQGCAMSIWVLLNMGLKLGGYVGMSGWLPFRRQIDSVIEVGTDHKARRLGAMNYMGNTVPVPSLGHCPPSERLESFATPVFLGHGSKDVKVRTVWGEEMRDTLRSLSVDVVWKGYEALEHWYKVPDEVEDISGFLRSVFSEK